MKGVVLSGQHAYIDIKIGRSKLAKIIASHKEVPVTIKGKIVDQFSGDDGTSIMFTIEMSDFKTGEPK